MRVIRLRGPYLPWLATVTSRLNSASVGTLAMLHGNLMYRGDQRQIMMFQERVKSDRLVQPRDIIDIASNTIEATFYEVSGRSIDRWAIYHKAFCQSASMKPSHRRGHPAGIHEPTSLRS